MPLPDSKGINSTHGVWNLSIIVVVLTNTTKYIYTM